MLPHAVVEPVNVMPKRDPSTTSAATAQHLVLLALAEHVAVLLQRASGKLGLLPQVGGEESVCVGDGDEGRLEGVLERLGGTGGRGVDVGHTGELEETLDGGRGDEAGTAGRGDETDGDGTALAGLLGGQRVRLTEVGAPVTSSDGHDAELGDDDGSADGGCDFLGGLDAETDVALGVTNDDDGLETGTLTGTGLLLDGLDLHDLVLELGKEEVDDLVLLDGERVEVAAQKKLVAAVCALLGDFDVHLLHALDLAGLYETAELGDGLPFLLLCQMSILSKHIPFTSISVPRSCRHDVHGRDRVHGLHGHHHEIQNRHGRGQVRQPYCESV